MSRRLHLIGKGALTGQFTCIVASAFYEGKHTYVLISFSCAASARSTISTYIIFHATYVRLSHLFFISETKLMSMVSKVFSFARALQMSEFALKQNCNRESLLQYHSERPSGLRNYFLSTLRLKLSIALDIDVSTCLQKHSKLNNVLTQKRSHLTCADLASKGFFTAYVR